MAYRPCAGGPGTGRPDAPATRLHDRRLTPDGVWTWNGWWWDPRSLHWLPSWYNETLRARVVEGAGYWRVTGRGRAYGTGDTFRQAWSAMVRREFSLGLL